MLHFVCQTGQQAVRVSQPVPATVSQSFLSLREQDMKALQASNQGALCSITTHVSAKLGHIIRTN